MVHNNTNGSSLFAFMDLDTVKNILLQRGMLLWLLEWQSCNEEL